MQSDPDISEEARLPRLVYTIREACQISTLSRATLYTHIDAGRLRVVRVGGRTLIPVESLHKLLEGDERDAE